MIDRNDLVRYARRARRRLGLVRSIRTALRTLFYALCTALVALITCKCLGLAVPWREGGMAVVSLVAGAALVARFIPRRSLLETAAEVDQKAGWKERLSSALSLPAPRQPMELALVEDVRDRLEAQPPSRLFPLRAPRELLYVPVVALALAAVSYFLPALDLLGVAAREKEKQKDKEDIALAVEKLERRRKELEKTDRSAEKVKEAAQKIDALAAELSHHPPPDRKEALAQISKLSDELGRIKEELAKTAALAEKLQKAASADGGDAGELGKLLREGKLDAAVQALARMRNALQEGKLSPAQREKLGREMEALAERLSRDRDLSEVEKKLAQAMAGLREGREQDLDGLQKELGQIEGALEEKDQLAQALQDLENLGDALAQGQGDCPTCGKPHAKGQKDGKG